MPKKAKEKRPVGRPRKNLGTRVSDVPVTTLKPMPRRINVDSVALARARMAYKRDYPNAPLTDNQTRAFIDAMQEGKSRGPVGQRILGTTKQTTVGNTTSGFYDYYKEALKEKKSEDAAATGVIASVDTNDEGVPTLRINPSAVASSLIRSLRAGITAGPASATSAAPKKTKATTASPRKSAVRFTRKSKAVNVTDLNQDANDALITAQAAFENQTGRAPTMQESRLMSTRLLAGRPAFDSTDIALPGSATSSGGPVLFQRVETDDERTKREADEARAEAERKEARRLRAMRRSPTTIGRLVSSAPPELRKELTKFQKIVQNKIVESDADPQIMDVLTGLVSRIKTPTTSRSKRVLEDEASAWVTNALQQFSIQPELSLAGPVQARVEPVEEEEEEGYQDLGDVFNQSAPEVQQEIIQSARDGNQTALGIVSAALQGQEVPPEVVPVIAGSGRYGRGYFDGFDSLLYNIHGTPDDNAKDLRDARAAAAAKGSGLGVQKKRGEYKLASAEFSDKVWNSASSLRWVRSAGLRPLKRAVHAKGKFIYHLADMSKFSKFDQQVATLKNGRKIGLVYGK